MEFFIELQQNVILPNLEKSWIHVKSNGIKRKGSSSKKKILEFLIHVTRSQHSRISKKKMKKTMFHSSIPAWDQLFISCTPPPPNPRDQPTLKYHSICHLKCLKIQTGMEGTYSVTNESGTYISTLETHSLTSSESQPLVLAQLRAQSFSHQTKRPIFRRYCGIGEQS